MTALTQASGLPYQAEGSTVITSQPPAATELNAPRSMIDLVAGQDTTVDILPTPNIAIEQAGEGFVTTYPAIPDDVETEPGKQQLFQTPGQASGRTPTAAKLSKVATTEKKHGKSNEGKTLGKLFAQRKKEEEEREKRHQEFTTKLFNDVTDRFMGKLDELFGKQTSTAEVHPKNKKRKSNQTLTLTGIPVQVLEDDVYGVKTKKNRGE